MIRERYIIELIRNVVKMNILSILLIIYAFTSEFLISTIYNSINVST